MFFIPLKRPIFNSIKKFYPVLKNYNTTPEEKKEFLRLLIKLSLSDQKIDESELIYIMKLGLSAGLSEESIRELTLNTSEIDIPIPESEQDRMSMLYYLLFLMKADSNVDNEEEKIVYHYGFKLGFAEGMIRDMIELIRSKVDTRIPPDDMIAIIKKYLN